MNGVDAGHVALSRFGLGSRADGDLTVAAADPRGFLKAELATPGIAMLGGPGLVPGPAAIQLFFADQEQKKAERERLAQEAAKDAAKDAAQMVAVQPTAAVAGPPTAAAPKPPQPPSPEQLIYRAETLARIRRAVESRCGLVERLVAFWSNHFCVSVAKSQFARISAGAFEREAIRPHVLGRFSDMLLAVESHPAMLHFLDNAQSIGPDSAAGLRQHRGLNENLAREIMELHTLGVDGGYTQADVTNLARILTGWTSVGAAGGRGTPGSFTFNAGAHQPGPQVLLGRTYAEEGAAQGEAALADIARHPATARFIATKFARHFVADAPPPALVARLAETFRAKDGDLRALTIALIDSDEAWSTPLTKMRSPYDYLIAVDRLMGHLPEEPGQRLGPLNLMGMPLWTPPGPNGFADTVATWAAPEGMKLRLEYAAQLANRLRDPPNPSELLDAAFGTAASPDTRQAVARAETRQQGLALLLMAPEMQRR